MVFHSAATSRTFLRTPNPLFTLFTRRLCLCVSKNQSGSFSRFPKAEPLVVEREFQGGENRNSPLGASLLPFFSRRIVKRSATGSKRSSSNSFSRSEPVETFTGTIVKQEHGMGDLFRGNIKKVGSFWEKFANQPIQIFHRTFLPWAGG